MGKIHGDEPTGWQAYFLRAASAAGYEGRGWRAKLARDIGVYDSHVSRWANGERVPDVDSCVKLAAALGRPITEVLIAAGRFTPEQLRVSDVPPAFPRRLPPHLERLATLLDNPDTPPDVRARIESLLSAAADLAEGSTSPERAIG